MNTSTFKFVAGKTGPQTVSGPAVTGNTFTFSKQPPNGVSEVASDAHRRSSSIFSSPLVVTKDDKAGKISTTPQGSQKDATPITETQPLTPVKLDSYMLEKMLKRERNTVKRLNSEIQGLQSTNEALSRQLDLLRRKTYSSSEQSRIHEKNWAALEILLADGGVLPYTRLLELVNRYNEAASETADFLATNVACKASDAFQEELDRAASEVSGLMGARLSALLSAQSKEAETATAKPHSSLASMLFQIFIIRFSVLDIEKVYYHTDDGETPAERPSGSQSISFETFKTSLLRHLSSLLKTACWTIPAKQTRIEFEISLETLFNARESLRKAVDETFRSVAIEIVVIEHGSAFQRDLIADALEAGLISDSQNSSPDDVVGTTAVGLRKVVANAEHATSSTRIILRSEVVVESTLQAALKGEEPITTPQLGLELSAECDGRA